MLGTAGVSAAVLPLAFLGDLLAGSGNFLLALLGIAFLIFIHEGGHFLAAKYCGVRVEVFSLGFGRRLWGFRRGDTDYRLSLLPLGGYVKMLGQDDADPSAPMTDREDDFRNKSVAKRALIMIGGVAVNALFAVLAFVIAFWIGVPFPSPQVGATTRGGPAHGKLEPGDEIVRIDGDDVIAFSDVAQIVAFSGGQPMQFEVLRDVGGEKKLIKAEIAAQPSEDSGLLSIGVEGLYVVGAIEAGSATEKEVDVQVGDRILSFKERADGPFQPFSRPSDLARLALDKPGESIEVLIERPRVDEESGEVIGIAKTVTTALPCQRRVHWSAGLRFDKRVRIRSVMPKTPAAKAGLNKGDILLAIDGRPARTDALPAVVAELCGAAHEAGRETVRLSVERAGETLELEAPSPQPKGSRKTFTLGFEYGSDTLAEVAAGGPAAKASAALRASDPEARVPQAGDRLVKVQLRKRFGLYWDTDQAGTETALQRALDALEGAEMNLVFARGEEEFSLVISGVKDESRPYGELELGFRQRQVLVRRGFFGALSLGFYSSHMAMRQVLQMLRSLIVRRDVSVKQLGGPIRIVYIANRVADRGPGKMIWFLALLSVNLAVLNILPIPVLDGGHLFFLMVEWLKGGPVPESVLVYAQWAGLFMILALILTVTFNDILFLLNLA